MSKHTGKYEWHDDDCLCKLMGIEYCNRNGYVWSCCGETEKDVPCRLKSSKKTKISKKK